MNENITRPTAIRWLAMAYEAAQFAKAQNPADIIEIVDRANRTKLVMLADGRTA
jgi:hypothetical protein